MKSKILVITPVKHIFGVAEKLESIGDVTYLDDPSEKEVLSAIKGYDAIFTNPNKSRVYLGKELIDASDQLKVICTASTGTTHLNKKYLKKKNISILCLKEERNIINKISSTAEHAFALTMSSIRNIYHGYRDVLKGGWDYEKFIGRQLDGLTIGIIGYGRLGTLYAKYSLVFGARVIVYDPYKKVEEKNIEQFDEIELLLNQSDVISFHIHVTNETEKMVNKILFNYMKPNVLLINTSRGEILDEEDLLEFLKNNNKAKIATDVLSDEINNRNKNPILEYARKSDQVIITPHIGGMTIEAQEIAYNHAANLLLFYFKGVK